MVILILGPPSFEEIEAILSLKETIKGEGSVMILDGEESLEVLDSEDIMKEAIGRLSSSIPLPEINLQADYMRYCKCGRVLKGKWNTCKLCRKKGIY